jgi:hypothetical protein
MRGGTHRVSLSSSGRGSASGSGTRLPSHVCEGPIEGEQQGTLLLSVECAVSHLKQDHSLSDTTSTSQQNLAMTQVLKPTVRQSALRSKVALCDQNAACWPLNYNADRRTIKL